MKYFLLIFWGCGALAQVRPPATELQKAIAAVQTQMETRIRQFNEKQATSADGQRQALERLKQAVTLAAKNRVYSFDGRSIQLEAKTRALFERNPVLPKEDKREGRWFFEPVRFAVVPEYLYAYGLSFKASRTIRVREVHLFFRDGTVVIHDTWTDHENGNGRMFEKREYLPMLHAYREGEPRQARILEAVEVVGSAQDGSFSAELSFLLEVPDPAVPGFREAKSRVAGLVERCGAADPDAASLNRCQRDLKQFAERIGLQYSVAILARD